MFGYANFMEFQFKGNLSIKAEKELKLNKSMKGFESKSPVNIGGFKDKRKC